MDSRRPHYFAGDIMGQNQYNRIDDSKGILLCITKVPVFQVDASHRSYDV